MKNIGFTASRSTNIALAALFVAAGVILAPTTGLVSLAVAHAQCDTGCDSYTSDTSTYYPDTSTYYPDTSTYYPDTSTYYPDTTSYYPDTTSYYPDTYSTPSYSSYSYPSYSSVYSMPSYSYPTYAAPSYSYPSVYTSLPHSVYSTPVVTTPSNTNVVDNGNTSVYAPVTDNGNSCTSPNSCNTTYDNHSVVNANTTITNPAPVINNVVSNPPTSVYTYATPVYQPTSVYTPVYQPVYQPAPQPVAYNNPATPYVTLSQVPYTGLDLGPFGTVAYWSFLILFCLFGAYLIVVKRAHRMLAHSIKVFLFGSTDETEVAQPVGEVAPTRVAPVAPSRLAMLDTTDEFILSQIKRARA